MPGSKRGENAREEGAAFEFNVQPVTLELDSDGRVNGVRFLRTQLGEPDKQGRRSPSPPPGSEFVMPADAVIMAFGFHPTGCRGWSPSAYSSMTGGGLRPVSRAATAIRPRTTKFCRRRCRPRRRSGGDGDGRRPPCGAGDHGLSRRKIGPASLTTNPTPQRSMTASFHAAGPYVTQHQRYQR